MKETRKNIHRKMLNGSGGGEAAALCVQTYRAFYINIQVFARMNKKKQAPNVTILKIVDGLHSVV